MSLISSVVRESNQSLGYLQVRSLSAVQKYFRTSSTQWWTISDKQRTLLGPVGFWTPNLQFTSLTALPTELQVNCWELQVMVLGLFDISKQVPIFSMSCMQTLSNYWMKLCWYRELSRSKSVPSAKAWDLDNTYWDLDNSWYQQSWIQ